ncbi:unnamed protein product [Timema podura]|uniref:Innexin n=1 Tax=Timema podura TaxID=61482 RepID=A0ABN7NZ81_TIMPD|nr:unnamed protein product [Timema podura]
MLQTFGVLAQRIRLKPKTVSIDNPVFRLHYWVTFLLLLVCSILVSSQQYFGEHIQCIADSGVPARVINTYCFFTGTFTVVKHLEAPNNGNSIPNHPGVGPMVRDEEPIIRHSMEGGRIQALVEGFENAALAFSETDLQVRGSVVPSKVTRDANILLVRKAFLQRLHINRPWASWLILCELLNAVNVIFQIVMMDCFLGGAFLTLAPDWLNSEVNMLDIVFPKVTKCIFHKYGPSGTIQNHDAMCVMALNVVNEKIYMFLWFWMWFLAAATTLGLIWRLVTIVSHSRSVRFNKIMFKLANAGIRDVWSLVKVTKECHFSDWLFLYYLAKNMDGFVFRDLFLGLAEEMDVEKDKQLELNHNDSDETPLTES